MFLHFLSILTEKIGEKCPLHYLNILVLSTNIITLDKCHQRIIKIPDEFNLKGKIHDYTMENTNGIKCINFMSIME